MGQLLSEVEQKSSRAELFLTQLLPRPKSRTLRWPSIHFNWEQLEHMEGLVLQIQSYTITLTQGNNRISERNNNEDSVLIVRQSLNQTNDSLQ